MRPRAGRHGEQRGFRVSPSHATKGSLRSTALTPAQERWLKADGGGIAAPALAVASVAGAAIWDNRACQDQPEVPITTGPRDKGKSSSAGRCFESAKGLGQRKAREIGGRRLTCQSARPPWPAV
jgi:hypothetical protein